MLNLLHELKLRISLIPYFSSWLLLALLYALIANAAWILPMIATCQKYGLEFCLLDSFVGESSKFTSCFFIIFPYLVLFTNSFVCKFKMKYIMGCTSRWDAWKKEVKFLLASSLAWTAIVLVITAIITMPFVVDINNWHDHNSYFKLDTTADLYGATVLLLSAFFLEVWLMLIISGIIAMVIHWLYQNIAGCYLAIALVFAVYQVLPIPTPLISYTNIQNPNQLIISFFALTSLTLIIACLVHRFKTKLIANRDFYA